jgi:hypothetical protein
MGANALQLFIRICLLSLGAGHPFRLLAGISGGICLQMLAEVAGNANPDNKVVFALTGLSTWYFIAFGVFVAVMTVLLQPRRVPEKPREIFDIIDEARARNGISELQQRQAYLNVISKVITDFTSPGAPAIPEGKDIAQQAIADTENHSE